MSKITEVNCETGEVIERDMTAEEFSAQEAVREQLRLEEEAKNTLSQAKAEAKASALAKLASLGLTEEEVAAITN